MTDHNNEYDAGVRDGKIASLEAMVLALTRDVSELKRLVYLLYGAIAVVQFLIPLAKTFVE